ncbi:unnamed protein product [Cuscuta europaea]|uniref:Transposase (putative) gypsy type domain-containing protein n=1 Tax=Cuscuta europaea TaxID=41803 RepID=A0A9P1E379_CUSEU|nr:unnamed protein product [Cuscuta europaea]
MGLRFPLHPFLLEYLRYIGLAPCQLTLNSHSYIAGFLNLCRSRGVTPSLDLFFQSLNLCRAGHANSEGFANLQQIAKWKLFSDAPSSHKGWKDQFCYIKMAVNPFPGELRNHFRRHPKVEGATFEKDGKKLSAIPEGREKHVKIKEMTLEDGLYKLSFRRYRFLGEMDEKYPVLDVAFESAGGSSRGLHFYALRIFVAYIHILFCLDPSASFIRVVLKALTWISTPLPL